MNTTNNSATFRQTFNLGSQSNIRSEAIFRPSPTSAFSIVQSSSMSIQFGQTVSARTTFNETSNNSRPADNAYLAIPESFVRISPPERNYVMYRSAMNPAFNNLFMMAFPSIPMFSNAVPNFVNLIPEVNPANVVSAAVTYPSEVAPSFVNNDSKNDDEIEVPSHNRPDQHFKSALINQILADVKIQETNVQENLDGPKLFKLSPARGKEFPDGVIPEITWRIRKSVGSTIRVTSSDPESIKHLSKISRADICQPSMKVVTTVFRSRNKVIKGKVMFTLTREMIERFSDLRDGPLQPLKLKIYYRVDGKELYEVHDFIRRCTSKGCGRQYVGMSL